MGGLHFLPPGPEAGPIDWSLRANVPGEILTPFGRHVQLDGPHSAHGDFPAFSQLPTELQFHILRFCDSATLFRLMQTSVALRNEAKKLFWSNPDAWYLVDGNWLLDGGFLGEIEYATEFIRQVQQVHVKFERIGDLLASDICEVEEKQGEGCFQGQNRRTLKFWDTLQRRFPSAVRVVITDDKVQEPGSILPSDIQRAVEGCPSGVDVYTSIVTLNDHSFDLATRNRTRLNTVDGCREVTESPWVRQTILIPPKVWHGPAGEYAEALHRINQWWQIQRGAKVLVVQETERSCFGEQGQVFSCPSLYPVCEAQFVSGREWAVHATRTRHWSNMEVPASYKEEVLRRNEMYPRPEPALVERYKRLDDQERETHKKGILNQLEQDPDYAQGKSIQESEIWMMYLGIIYRCMHEEEP